MAYALTLRLNESVFVGEDEQRWTLVAAEFDRAVVRLACPDGRVQDVTGGAAVELEPEIFVELGAGRRAANLLFRAPSHVPIHHQDTQAWIEARRGDM